MEVLRDLFLQHLLNVVHVLQPSIAALLEEAVDDALDLLLVELIVLILWL